MTSPRSQMAGGMAQPDVTCFAPQLQDAVLEVLRAHPELPACGIDYPAWVTGSLGDIRAPVWFVPENPRRRQRAPDGCRWHPGAGAAARELAAASPDCDLAHEEEETAASSALPATVAEIDYLDLRRENIAAIIWATGYDYDYGWLQAPVLGVQGRPLQQRGVTPVPGSTGPALDAYAQVRAVLRRRSRRGVPRRTHISDDRASTTASPSVPRGETLRL